MGAVPIDKG